LRPFIEKKWLGLVVKTDVCKYLGFKKPMDVSRALCPMYDYGDDYNSVLMYLTPDGNSLSYYPLLRSYHNQTAVGTPPHAAVADTSSSAGRRLGAQTESSPNRIPTQNITTLL
jgi:hypothetical protein